MAGIGRTVADRSIWLYYVGEVDEGIQAGQSALKLLPSDQQHYRCAAHQALCQLYRVAMDKGSAAEEARKAMRLAGVLPRISAAKLRWLWAGIEADLANFDRAESLMVEVLGSLEHNRVEYVLATVDLVEIQLEQSHTSAANETSRQLLAEINEVENPHIARAILELVRHGQEGLTPDRLQDCREQVGKNGRRQRLGSVPGNQATGLLNSPFQEEALVAEAVTLGRRQVQCIHEVLQAKIETSPWRVRDLMAALKKNPNWLAERRHAGRLEVGDLLDSLIFLGLDPLDFFAAAIGPRRGPPPGEPTPAVERALERIRVGGPRHGVSNVVARRLAEIDLVLRYDDPELATLETEVLLEQVPWNEVPRILGILGSCYRMKAELGAAEHAIWAGLENAKELSVAAELNRRLAYVAGDLDAYQRALRLVERAIACYSTLADLEGIGKAVSDRCIWLYHAGKVSEGIQAGQTALRLLPLDMRHYRCATHQSLCQLYRVARDLPSASTHAALAQAHAEVLPRISAAKLTWLEAGIEADRSNFGRAEVLMRHVLQNLRQNQIETVLATVDLVELQLRMGHLEEANETARNLLPTSRLLNNRHVARAVLELVRHGRDGLTSARLRIARAEIRKGRRPSRPDVSGLSLTS